MAYLDANPPAHQQFRCPRRERPSGIIGVHTAESHPDESGPDTGAESVARFIRDRSNYGSYHLLVDSGSIVQLVRFECVAYHIATHGLNEHTIGISAATQAAKWNGLSSGYRDAMVRNMARAATRAAEWLHEHYGITVPARRINLAQARRGERGFLAHGDADPARRTDPGATFPWSDFLSYYADEMSGDGMDWNDDLDSDGTRRTMSPMARDIIPDSWGTHPAQLLGYAAATLAWLRNEHWEKPNEPGKKWPQIQYDIWGYVHSARAKQAAEQARDLARANGAKLDALMDAQQGLDTNAIKAHIDEHYQQAASERAELATALEAAQDERADILALVEQVGSGERDAAAVVDEIADRLADGDDESDDAD